MTELRDYILSKLQEQLGKAERNPAGQKAVADWKMKRRVGKKGGPVRVGQSETGDLASTSTDSPKLKQRGSRALGQTSGGMRRWSNIQQGHSADARQNASTDLRTQLAYVLADKLEELSQETMDDAARRRTDQLRDPGHKGKEVPVYRGGTGGTDAPEQIGTRTTPGKGVILQRLQGRKATPDKPEKKALYAGKITPGATGKEARAAAKARKAGRQDSSTNLKDRMVDILMEMRGDQYKKHNPRSVYATGERPIPKRKSKDAEILGRSLQVDKTFQSGKPATPAAKEKLSGYFNYRPDVAKSLGVQSAMDQDDGEEPRSGSYFRNRNNGLSER